MSTASIVALVALAQAASASVGTAPGSWAAYSSWIGSSTTRPTGHPDGAIAIGQGGGRFPIFAVSLTGGRPGGRLVADAASPRNFDSYYRRASDVTPEPRRSDPDGRARADHELLEAGIDHHRPTTRFEVAADGSLRIVKSAAAKRHERCARRLLRASSNRLIALAETEPHREVERSRRSHTLRMAELPPRGPSVFLRLVQLPLPLMSGTRWSEYERQIGADDPGELTQNSFRTDMTRAAGREVGLHLNLLTDRTSVAARLCRSMRVRRVGRPVTDECRIEGIIDRRDGWPIFISISRSVTASNHATTSSSAGFSRLAPLEGFVPPPNPCLAR